jgi:DNA primase
MLRNNRNKRRADRLIKDIDLADFLNTQYGYRLHAGQNQQFSCDIHGRDRSPSARYYAHGNRTFCFVCNASRDIISYVCIKENIPYNQALDFLEKKYSLEPLPWEEDTHYEDITPSDDYQRLYARIERLLKVFTRERTLSLQRTTLLWHILDKIHMDHQNTKDGQKYLLALRERILNA